MQRVIQRIEDFRAKLQALRSHELKETPTRTIVIDPLLEALGWDVRDPGEVQLEYPTVDGKSVDYALKLNGRAALLVEAKPLDDPLNDVKAVTQVVAYAANDGIVWCILTNGIRWKVFRSVERCPAPDKLMFEVSLDPKDSEGLTVTQLAEQMWRFSRDELARGTLDALGEQTFTDGKVRKVLGRILRDPPRAVLNSIRAALGDDSLTAQRVKTSLARVAGEIGLGPPGTGLAGHAVAGAPAGGAGETSVAAHRAGRGRRTGSTKKDYGEPHHVSGMPQEVLELYRAIDRVCLALEPGGVEKRYLAKSINYYVRQRAFCSVHLQRAGLWVWVCLKYARLDSPPPYARDVSNIGHWGVGDLELAITSLSQINDAARLIRMSFEARAS